MKFRTDKKNETPLRLMIEHMPGKFSKTVANYKFVYITLDGRFGGICTLSVHRRRG